MSKQKTSTANSGKRKYNAAKTGNGEIVTGANGKVNNDLPLTQGATWGFNLETDQKCVKPIIRTIGNNPYALVDQAFAVLDYARKVGESKNYVVAPLNATPQ